MDQGQPVRIEVDANGKKFIYIPLFKMWAQEITS